MAKRFFANKKIILNFNYKLKNKGKEEAEETAKEIATKKRAANNMNCLFVAVVVPQLQ